MEIKKQQIIIELGEKDLIIGSPTYGQPMVNIKIEGLTALQAQSIVLNLTVQLSKQINDDFNKLLKRVK